MSIQETPETRALKAFEEWLAADPSRSVAAFARLIQVSGPAVFQWRAKRARPDVSIRRLIRIAIGIPEEWWDTEEELAARATLESQVAAAAAQMAPAEVV